MCVICGIKVKRGDLLIILTAEVDITHLVFAVSIPNFRAPMETTYFF